MMREFLLWISAITIIFWGLILCLWGGIWALIGIGWFVSKVFELLPLPLPI